MTQFFDIMGFVAHIEGRQKATDEAIDHGLERAAAMVEREAKRELGTYQDTAGFFVGWADLADSTKAGRALAGVPEDEPLLITGKLRDSIEHVSGHCEAYVGSNDPIAVYQELGTNKIPPRSFLGHAAVVKGEAVARMVGDRVVAAIVGEGVFQKSMEIFERD